MTDQAPKNSERANQPANPDGAMASAQPRRPKAVEPSSKASQPPVRCIPAQQELDVLIRARYPIVYVVTWEEERVERSLREIAAARNKNLFVWTITQGIVKSGSDAQHSK